MSREAPDMSWSEAVPYSCACGTQFEGTRQRWVDAEADRALRDRVAEDGPLSGRCPNCGVQARARSNWLELHPTRKEATLVLGPEQRADLVDQLETHLETVKRRGPLDAPWLLRPDWRFEQRSHVTASSHAAGSGRVAGIPQVVGGDRGPEPSSSSPHTVRDAFVAQLSIEGDLVTIDASLDDAERRNWGTAAVRARPIHISGLAYPLAGIRVVASYLGQTSVLDGLVDVASSAADPVFSALSRSFRLQLVIRDRQRKSTIRREIAAAGLERNAALCLESARSALATREYAPDTYKVAWRELAAQTADQRVRPARCSLAAGAFQHLLAPRETWSALEELNRASAKDNLAHLLQVDGLPVGEYEAIRKRVLRASIEQGICAPSRFWRRIVDTGLANNIGNYADKLVEARQSAIEQEFDDLDADQSSQAWQRIYELCRKKHLDIPKTVLHALENQPTAAPRVQPKPLAAGVPKPVPTVGSGTVSGEIATGSRGRGPASSTLVGPNGPDSARAAKLNDEKKKPLTAAPISPPAATDAASATPALATGPLGLTAPRVAVAPAIPEIREQNPSAPLIPPAVSASVAPPPKAEDRSPATRAPVVPKPPEAPEAPELPGSLRAPAGAAQDVPQIVTPAPEACERQNSGREGGGDQSRARERKARDVFVHWDEVDLEQLLDLAPELAMQARSRVATLMFKLISPDGPRAVAAAVLLAISQDSGALAPLACRLFRDEREAVWRNLAWCFACFGPESIDEIFASSRDPNTVAGTALRERLSVVFAEMALSHGERMRSHLRLAHGSGGDDQFGLAVSDAFATLDVCRTRREGLREAIQRSAAGHDESRSSAGGYLHDTRDYAHELLVRIGARDARIDLFCRVN